ncbi:MAG: ribosome maturation factor RimM [Actinomycetota bacterium]
MPERLEVGRIGRAHGLHGEVSVAPVTNRPERFAVGSVLFVDDRRLVIETSRPHQDRFLVRFAGVADRTAAEGLRGSRLRADPLPEAPPGEVWVHEVIGAEVVDRADRSLGRVVAVEANPAHDLLVLSGGELVPMVFVVDVAPGRVVIDPPEGLLDL